jgi:hypothetical protein
MGVAPPIGAAGEQAASARPAAIANQRPRVVIGTGIVRVFRRRIGDLLATSIAARRADGQSRW